MPVAVTLPEHTDTAGPQHLLPLPPAAFRLVPLLTVAEVGDGSLVALGQTRIVVTPIRET
jgi:hypothetical protein